MRRTSAAVDHARTKTSGRQRRVINRKGTIYVEYFVLATAAALAALWLWDGGNFHGLVSDMQDEFNNATNTTP